MQLLPTSKPEFIIILATHFFDTRDCYILHLRNFFPHQYDLLLASLGHTARGFIRGRAVAKLTGCENNFASVKVTILKFIKGAEEQY